MRVLVVGTTSPPGGRAARSLARAAGTHLLAGDEVVVLSPDPSSVSHQVANLSGPLLGVRLLLASRRFDAAIVRIERGVPLSDQANRWSRALSLSLLGLALRTYREVTIRLDTPIPMPGGVGGRATRDLWRSATKIIVENDGDRTELSTISDEVAQRIVVEAVVADDDGRGQSLSELDESATSEEILTVVRARARRYRSVASTRSSLVVEDTVLGLEALALSKPLRPSVRGIAGIALHRVKRGLVGARSRHT